MRLNPFSYEFHADPYPTYRWLRDNDPCHHNEELGFWALTRYADVVEASRDWETFSSAEGPMIEKTSRELLDPLPMMISEDPPRHDLLRGLVSRVFTPRAVAALEPAMRAIVTRDLDRLAEAGGGDFVADFAANLPMEVIFTLLGVPETERVRLRRLTDLTLDRDPDSAAIPERAMEAGAEMAAWWFGFIDDLRRQPGDDFVSRLMAAELTAEDGTVQRLTNAEVAGFCGLIGAAGSETTTKLLANAAVLFQRHRDQRDALVADPTRIPAAVEEVLRYWAPSQYQGRAATRDVTIHDRTIPVGARVILVTGSANRDEREYDDPDRFDIARDQHLSLGFGYGVHFCLGAALARLESRVALEELLRRFPAYSVDESGLHRVHMSNVHGFDQVPIRV